MRKIFYEHIFHVFTFFIKYGIPMLGYFGLSYSPVQEQIHSAWFFQTIYHFFGDSFRFLMAQQENCQATQQWNSSAGAIKISSRGKSGTDFLPKWMYFLQVIVWWVNTSVTVKESVVTILPFYIVASNIFQAPLWVEYVHTSKYVSILIDYLHVLLLVHTLTISNFIFSYFSYGK